MLSHTRCYFRCYAVSYMYYAAPTRRYRWRAICFGPARDGCERSRQKLREISRNFTEVSSLWEQHFARQLVANQAASQPRQCHEQPSRLVVTPYKAKQLSITCRNLPVVCGPLTPSGCFIHPGVKTTRHWRCQGLCPTRRAGCSHRLRT